MRGFAILAVVVAVQCSTLALAAERPQSRLPGYDKAVAPQLRRGGTTAPAKYREPDRYADERYDDRYADRYAERAPGRSRPQGVRRAQYTEPQRRAVQPSHYQEDIPPGATIEGPTTGEFYEGEYFDGGFGGDYCGDCCDDGCYGPMPGLWGRAEYLYWWVRGYDTPPLVTTSPNGTSRADAGVLPDASILFGDERVNQSGRSGARFTLGYWFGCCELMGVDSSFFFLGDVTEQYYNDGPGIIARPFFNVDSGSNDAQLINFPNVVDGRINISSESKVYGGDLNLRRVLVSNCWNRFDVLAGYRYFGLSEGLSITTNTESTDPQSPIEVGTLFDINDTFTTRNLFNGGQIGVNYQMLNGCWTLDFLAKVAFGSNSQTVSINGSTVRTLPDGAPVDFEGGILALPSNIGTYTRNQFAVLPEFGVDVRYQLTPLWKLNVGYTLLILTNVVRPGDQIDEFVDPNQFPQGVSGTQPRFTYVDSDVWVQGINFGIETNF
jgi:hypothetical protein